MELVMKTTTDTLHSAPESFLAPFGEHCSGISSGFDRMRFMGSFRTLQDARGMAGYLYRAGVLLKCFRDYAEALTERGREQAQARAAAAGLEVEYLPAAPRASNCSHRRPRNAAAGRPAWSASTAAWRKSPREIRAERRETSRV
jgi:hypothetical protein